MLFALLLITAAAPDWVPARWRWLETKTLDLLSATPVNCLLIEWNAQQKAEAGKFAAAAAERGIATLAVIHPGGDPSNLARGALRGKVAGVVPEGDFPAGAAGPVIAAITPASVIELTARS